MKLFKIKEYCFCKELNEAFMSWKTWLDWVIIDSDFYWLAIDLW